MEGRYCYNILDFDGVLVPGEELMDEYIWEICKEATNIYCEGLFRQQTELIKYQQQLEEDRNIYGKEMQRVIHELEELKRLIQRHFELKDQVLEETEEKYRNKINYNEIYQLKNVFPGVLEAIWKIHDSGIYVQQISNTHVNAEREIIAKKILLQKEFPPMKFVPIRYHIEPYRDQYGAVNKNRQPSDKVGRLLRTIPSIDPTLVDNSRSIINRGDELGLRTYFVEKNTNPYIIQNPVLNPIPSQVIIQAANDTIDIVHEGKVKKLSI